MRIGLIADVHGNAYGLKACLSALRAASVDRILCAGDIIGYYPFVNEALDLLIAEGVSSIAGNHEAYFLGRIPIGLDRYRSYALDWVERHLTSDHRTYLAGLPQSLEVEVDGTRLSLFHGSPWSIEEYVYPDRGNFDRFRTVDADVVVLGHTHIPMAHQAGSILVVNPGSCGQPRDYDPRASCAVLDTRTRGVNHLRAAYDIEVVCRAVAAAELHPDLSAILTRTVRPSTSASGPR